MKTVDCDILIIGGGPGGSSAALQAAQSGCRVIVVERKSRFGVPVRCAEYIPAPLIAEVNLGREYVTQAIKGMRTYLPDGEFKETKTPGFTIERDLFDLTLANASEKAGAEIWLSASALTLKNGRVIVFHQGSEVSVRAKVIIGADGPHSKVARWIESPNRNLMAGAQLLAPLDQTLDYTEIYFDPEIFCGYGWVFPKYDFANVGVGIKTNHPKGCSVKRVLDNFISKLVKENKILPPVSQRYTAGWIPAEAEKKVRQDNILLVGDAAGHTHPITGAGIFSAVTGGKIAGKWAVKAINESDLQQLDGYEKEVQDFFGPHLRRAFDRRQFMENRWDDFENIIKQSWVAYREYYEQAA